MKESLTAARYRLVRRLGHGAMGDVWLADDLELERPVALKLLAPDADRARFEREARAAAALNHTNLTRLYDYGHDSGRPFMALEYLPGGSLEDRLADGEPLDDDVTRDIATQIAAGLAHAHAGGLVHRDLKPSNILFDDEGRAKIADFGIASIRGGTTLTDEGTVLGTAGYISPEQATGEPATPASDVYALGVVLFRMLTGRLPFEAESAVELAGKHVRLDAPLVAEVRPDAPARLAAVADSALARDPRARPQDGRAVERTLREGAPTGASAPTVVLGTPRRSRLGRAVIVAGLLLLAAGGVTAAVLLTHTNGSGHGATVPTVTRQQSRPATHVGSSTSESTSSTTGASHTTPVAPPTAPVSTARATTPATTATETATTTTTATTTGDTTTNAPNP